MAEPIDARDVTGGGGVWLEVREPVQGPRAQPILRLATFPLGTALLVSVRCSSQILGSDAVTQLRATAVAHAALRADATTPFLQSLLGPTQDDVRALASLSRREREIVAFTATGHTAHEIGRRLFLSPRTVETYRSRTMKKLGLRHRRELVQFALRVGLWSRLARDHA
ncbi:MAG: response regulator transcription factor [Gemmatimonadales bacterium]